MASKDEILKAAALAKLKLTPEEEDKFTKNLADIIAYVSELTKADTRGVEAASHITGMENAFREDVEPADEDKMPEGGHLIEQAPKVKDGYVVVPRILTDL